MTQNMHTPIMDAIDKIMLQQPLSTEGQRGFPCERCDTIIHEGDMVLFVAGRSFCWSCARLQNAGWEMYAQVRRELDEVTK